MQNVIEVRNLHKAYGDALNAVTSVLARQRIVAKHLRVDQANLEDAFLKLTRWRHGRLLSVWQSASCSAGSKFMGEGGGRT